MEKKILFEFKSIPEKPPRPISFLPGLKYSAIFDKSIIFQIIFIGLLIGIFPAALLLSAEKSFRLPFLEMEKAEGKVIEVMDNSKCNKSSISIHYQFITKAGRTYYGKYVSYQGNLYSMLKVGDILPIVYDLNDPGFNGIESEIGKGAPPFFVVIFLIFFILIFVLIFPYKIKQFHDARSISKKGFITKGEIVFIRREKIVYPRNSVSGDLEVFYRFHTVAGELIEAKQETDNIWLVNKLDTGSPVTISYLENKPQKSIILDFYYR